MDNKIYSLTVAGKNGSYQAKNLTQNGNNYVSENEVDTSSWPSIFELTVKDGDGNITEHIENAKLLQQVSYDWDGGKFYLAFAPVSEQELLKSQLAAMEEANTNTEIALCEVYEMLLGGVQ